MEVIISYLRGFRLVEAFSRCLGSGKESSVAFSSSSRELNDQIQPEILPAVEKHADSSPTPESDPPPADPPATRTAPRERLQALALSSVPAPGGSTGSGGKHNQAIFTDLSSSLREKEGDVFG